MNAQLGAKSAYAVGLGKDRNLGESSQHTQPNS